MNKSELVKALAAESEFTISKSKVFLEAFVRVISACLAEGDKVVIQDFGTFKVIDRKEHQGRNPQSGMLETYPAKRSAKFEAGKSLKEQIEE